MNIQRGTFINFSKEWHKRLHQCGKAALSTNCLCLRLLQESPAEEASPLDVLESAAEEPTGAKEADEPVAPVEEASEAGEVAAPEKGWKLTPEGDAAILQGDIPCLAFACVAIMKGYQYNPPQSVSADRLNACCVINCPICKQRAAGEDETITFSFGSLVDKLKRKLTASASPFSGRKTSNAGLAAAPPPAPMPKTGLSAPSKGPSVQRMQAMSDGERPACTFSTRPTMFTTRLDCQGLPSSQRSVTLAAHAV